MSIDLRLLMGTLKYSCARHRTISVSIMKSMYIQNKKVKDRQRVQTRVLICVCVMVKLSIKADIMFNIFTTGSSLVKLHWPVQCSDGASLTDSLRV